MMGYKHVHVYMYLNVNRFFLHALTFHSSLSNKTVAEDAQSSTFLFVLFDVLCLVKTVTTVKVQLT